jgi:hypothetical protein
VGGIPRVAVGYLIDGAGMIVNDMAVGEQAILNLVEPPRNLLVQTPPSLPEA